MYFLKNLIVNFLVVFFADHILPGIEVNDLTRLPHLGGDLIFAFSLGLLNASIYPVMKILKQDGSIMKLVLVTLVLNFFAYGILKLLPTGIKVTSVEGYLLVSVIVALGGFLTNFFEMKRHAHKMDITQ